MKNKILNIIFLTLLSGLVMLSSCKKMVDVDVPVNSLTRDNVFTNDETAIPVATGLFGSMVNARTPVESFTQLSFTLGLSADEIKILPGQSNIDLKAFYSNNLSANPEISFTTNPWAFLYSLVYKANDLVAGFENNTDVSPNVRKQLLGEAKFSRALFYFYLVNLYGDVPLALTTDYKVNSNLSRSPKAAVYNQMVADLNEAISLLSAEYLDGKLKPGSERVRPTKWAAIALLARTYLYMGEYAKAEAQSGLLIDNNSLFSLTDLDGVFLNSSTEAIWQLQNVSSTAWNTIEGFTFNLPGTGPTSTSTTWPFFLPQAFLGSFEAGDLRRTKWISSVTVPGGATYSYPFKYKMGLGSAPGQEYSTLFRLGEQYLIRAEARIRQNGKLSLGIQDLNVIRGRARAASSTAVPDPLPDLPLSASQSDALSAVMHERQTELFTEYGHRWLDIKRTGTVDQVMGQAATDKGSPWRSFQQLYPIPQNDINFNGAIGNQNPGY